MKKFLMMFACMATVLMSVVSFISCSEKEETITGLNSYKFSVVYESQSNDANVVKLIQTANAAFVEAYKNSFTVSESEANNAWNQLLSKGNFQKIADETGAELKDPTFTVIATMAKNGDVVKKETYKTSYK